MQDEGRTPRRTHGSHGASGGSCRSALAPRREQDRTAVVAPTTHEALAYVDVAHPVGTFPAASRLLQDRLRASRAAGMQLKQEDRAMQIRNILAPTDFSDASNQAVMYAFGLARACGAKLSLLHVVEPLAFPLDGYIPPDLITTLLDDLKRGAYMRLADLLCEAGAANVKVIRHVVVGVPYETILETA